MKHCLEVLKHGKHVAVAVPAVFGSLEDADRLYEAVKSSGLKYMMFETSCYHADLHAMRQIYQAGGLGKIVYAEGEYYHYMDQPIDSFRAAYRSAPFYPTHSPATGQGHRRLHRGIVHVPSLVSHLQPGNNRYSNGFIEIALFG
jgi:predicted dehydrogenase